MDTLVPRPRLLVRAVLGLAALMLCAIAAFVVAPAASAHDELLATDPEQGSVVDTLPEEISMTFSGLLLDEAGATEVSVTSADGTSLTDGDPILDGTGLTQPLDGSASGTVTVLWRVVSSDGHPIAGDFTFDVGAASATSTSAASPGPSESSAPENSGDDFPWPLVITVAIVVLGAGLVVALVATSRRRRED